MMAAEQMRTVPSFVPGGRLDLDEPRPEDFDWQTIAARLARTYRFKGEAGAISVAQHSVMGAEALLAETRDQFTAALFVLHDAHEFAIGDEARDVSEWKRRALGPIYVEAVNMLKARLDRAIYAKAGLPDPECWTVAQYRLVKSMDERMQSAELLALYGPRAVSTLHHSVRKTPCLQSSLNPWPAELAAERFLGTLSKFTGRIFR